MNLVKKALMFVGFVVLTAAGVSVLAPKATHALVATLVQVVSSTSNPVISLSADTATRIPYRSGTNGGICNGGTCVFPAATTVPAGYRLVVQSITGVVPVTGNEVPTGYLTYSSTGIISNTPLAWFTGTYAPPGMNSATANAYYNEPVTAVLDATQAPVVIFNVNTPDGFNGYALILGYLENCAVVGCPRVQE